MSRQAWSECNALRASDWLIRFPFLPQQPYHVFASMEALQKTVAAATKSADRPRPLAAPGSAGKAKGLRKRKTS